MNQQHAVQLIAGPVLGDREFTFFSQALLERSGILLTNGKRSLVEARLKPRLDALGLGNYADYQRLLESLPPQHDEWQALVNMLTTNVTQFFREPQHYDYLLQKFLPDWTRRARGRTLRVWSAACSTGEEVYTLAMILERYFNFAGGDFSLLASDIDTQVLAVARNGVYLRSKLKEVPDAYRAAFSFGSGEIREWMRIKPQLRAKIQFRIHNLTTGPLVMPAPFDLIVCRNVLIYFSAEMVRTVACHLYNSSASDAVLVISHSESLQQRDTPWTYAHPSIYGKGRA